MSPISGFLLRTLAWLPICFAAWYFLSILFTPLLALLVEASLTALFPAVIDSLVADGNAITVLTRIQVASADGRAGDLLLDLNPLIYGYCVPLYTALVLATNDDELRRLLHWVLGMVLLLMVQVFGMSTEVLKTIAFQIGDVGPATLDFAPWGYDLLAIAYQLGYLILPPVMPIMLWLGQFGRTQAELMTAGNGPLQGDPQVKHRCG